MRYVVHSHWKGQQSVRRLQDSTVRTGRNQHIRCSGNEGREGESVGGSGHRRSMRMAREMERGRKREGKWMSLRREMGGKGERMKRRQ